MTTPHIAIIPRPQSITRTSGHFTLNADTQILAAPDMTATAHYLAELLRPATGYPLPVTSEADANANTPNTILLSAPAEDTGNNYEGYQLHVTPQYIDIRAATSAGLFNGVQTLRQLLPPAIESQQVVTGMPWRIPAGLIQDWPEFTWRGLHLDVARHWFPVDFIKRYLDLMALHKLNVFHWHLTDDQGWRIEIKQYPKLTAIGSHRRATPLPHDRTQSDGQPYSGHYTQDDIREVVAYAAARNITVVPEIEMPGHALAVLAGYPELGCVGTGYEVWTQWGIAEEVFCAGNEAVFTFLQNVLSEVLELFPSEYIHIGGDECPKTRWRACPKCQARIHDEGLVDEDALQSYFVRRIERWLNDHGRRLIGWDEILEGGLAPNATVMNWRGTSGGIAAARAGHDVVMTPMSHCYLDYYQSTDRDQEPPAIGNYLPLERVYAFDPQAGISEDRHAHVLGGQGNLWTEYIPTTAQIEYMAYPRAAALAEAVWSSPDSRNFEDFRRRWAIHQRRLDQMGVNYRDPGR